MKADSRNRSKSTTDEQRWEHRSFASTFGRSVVIFSGDCRVRVRFEVKNRALS